MPSIASVGAPVRVERFPEEGNSSIPPCTANNKKVCCVEHVPVPLVSVRVSTFHSTNNEASLLRESVVENYVRPVMGRSRAFPLVLALAVG